MSWLETNYEKASLGGAAVVALGLAFMGWSKYGNVESDFANSLKHQGNNNAAVQDAELIPKAVSSLTSEHIWVPAIDKERPVDLFVGIPLFIPSAAPTTTIDPWRDEPIHPPIPNKWWLDHKLDPGNADSPARDPDADGYSNLEEYLAKTDPNDAASFPPLIAKLKYVRDESLTWAIRPSYGSEGKFPFNYVDSTGVQNKTGAADMVAPGGMFFSKGVMKDRFKFLGAETRQEMSPKTNSPVEITYVRIEDQKPNKKGKVYEIPAPLSEERMNEHRQYDRTAVMSLQALGNDATEVKVEEFTTFSLPFGGAKKDYLLKSVEPESITVEYTDAAGEKKTVKISKGSTPDMSE